MVATAAIIALGGTGIGLQLKGAQQAGKAAEAQAKSENAWQEYNAKIADREAKQAQETAGFEERKQRKAGERLKARRRTQAGKAGILLEGSFEDVSEEVATELEIDALMIRRGGEVGAQALSSQAQLSRLKGRSAILRGRAKRRAAGIGGFARGLSSASQLTFAVTG